MKWKCIVSGDEENIRRPGQSGNKKEKSYEILAIVIIIIIIIIIINFD